MAEQQQKVFNTIAVHWLIKVDEGLSVEEQAKLHVLESKDQWSVIEVDESGLTIQFTHRPAFTAHAERVRYEVAKILGW